MNKLHLIMAGAAVALAACSHSGSGWKVQGTIENAPEGAKLAVEAFNGARWYSLDSVEVASDGSFSYAAVEPAHVADVYRLSLGGKSIYFPVDSVDEVTIAANASSFGSEYTLSGSPLAEQMYDVDRILSQPVDSLAKAALNRIILDDSVGVVAYYVINKNVNGRPLYDPAVRSDLGMIGAIANKFAQRRPDDPRTKYLAQRFLQARKANGMSAPAQYKVTEVNLLDISLFDKRGKQQSLQAIAEASPVVILSFSAYGLEGSPAYNVELNRLYEQYRGRGLAIYQVGFDESESEWLQAAENLPWVTVYNTPATGDKYLAAYNVGALPMTFIIDHGAIADRVADPTQLAKTLAKYF